LENYIKNDKFEIFSCLLEFLTDNDVDIKQIKNFITAYLINLQISINRRFEEKIHINEINAEHLKIREKLVDFSSDENLRILRIYKKMHVLHFGFS